MNLNENLLRNFNEIKANIITNKEQVLDARGSSDFERVDPLDGLDNHIPNSKNVPYGDLFDSNNGLIKDKKEILERKNKKMRKFNFRINNLIKLFILYFKSFKRTK